ncbi:MAG TPA: hypothetical protein VJ783_07900, partial [Pirellulales bacterium]|nr:hypothetical protein [Pirellulales bacterium]
LGCHGIRRGARVPQRIDWAMIAAMDAVRRRSIETMQTQSARRLPRRVVLSVEITLRAPRQMP